MDRVCEEISIESMLVRDDFEKVEIRQVIHEDLLIEDEHERIKRSFLYACLAFLKPSYSYLKEEIILIEGKNSLERLMSVITAKLFGFEKTINIEEAPKGLSELVLMGILHFVYAHLGSNIFHLKKGLSIAKSLEPYFDLSGNSTLSFSVDEEKYNDVFHHTLFYILFSFSLKSRSSERTKQLIYLLDPLSKGLFVRHSSLCSLLLRMLEKCNLPEAKEEVLDEKTPFTFLSGETYSASFSLTGKATGMGSLSKNGSQIVLSMGPHFYPLGSAEEFGISYQGDGSEMRELIETREGRYHYEVWNQVSYKVGEWSPFWISMQVDELIEGVEFRLGYEVFGRYKLLPMAFVLFIKGDRLQLGSDIMQPKTLKRYQGECKSIVAFQGDMQLEVQVKGANALEIIPLAGSGHYWGSDFLVAFQFKDNNQPISLNLK